MILAAQNPLSPIIDLLVSLPSIWIMIAVIITFALQGWHRTIGSLVGLSLCPIYALWGHEIYLRHMKVSLFGAVPLTETGFYVVTGVLALYYGYILWHEFDGWSRRKRLRETNKKWGG